MNKDKDLDLLAVYNPLRNYMTRSCHLNSQFTVIADEVQEIQTKHFTLQVKITESCMKFFPN